MRASFDRFLTLRFVLALAFLPQLSTFGCRCAGEDPLTGTCARDLDCVNMQVCVRGACTDPDPMFRLDGGLLRDAHQEDKGPPSDASSLEDAPSTDANGLEASILPDAEAGDVPFLPDTGVPDAQAIDGGPAMDSGPAIAISRGSYAFRRLFLPSISATGELAELALSPDDRTLIVGARMDRIYVVDVQTETSSITITLPKDSNEPISITGIAYAQNGGYVLITGNAQLSGQVQGRTYRSGPHGESLIEIGTRRSGVSLEAIAVAPSGEVRVIGYDEVGGTYGAYVWRYDDGVRGLVDDQVGFTMAGCQDLAFVRDTAIDVTVAFTCGINGAEIGTLDGTGGFLYGPPTGNTSHIASRPDLTYALAVDWSAGRLLRYESGLWTAGSAAPDLASSRLWNVAFSTDGIRALITGQYDAASRALILREFRHDLYTTSEIASVSIPAFDLPPWNGASGAIFNDAVWRSAGDCGFIVGGCSSGSCMRGYLVSFQVTNGRPCP